MIIQGDQYSLPFTITSKKDGTKIIPDIVSKVDIQLGEQVYSFPNNGLTYENEKWVLWLDKGTSQNFPKFIDAQIGVEFNDEPTSIRHSLIKRIPIQKKLKGGV